MKTIYIKQLNCLRFLGCLWIVIAHYSRFLSVGKPLFYNHSLKLIANGANILDVFFVLSGFILCHVYKDNFKKFSTQEIKHYFKRRIARIYPAYFFSLLIVVILVLHNVNVTNFGDYSIFSLILNLFLLQSYGFLSVFSWNIPGWSVSSEFQMYCVFPFMSNFLKVFRKKFYIFLLILSFLVIIYYIPRMLPENSRAAHSLCLGYGIFRVMPDFMIGYLSYIFFEKIHINDRYSIAWDIIAIIMLFLFIELTKLSYDRVFVIASIAVLLVSLSKSQHFSKTIFGFQPLVFLGDISYSMYLLQFPLEILSNQFFSKKINFLSQRAILDLFIGHILLLIGIAAISYWLIELRWKIIINPKQWLHFTKLLQYRSALILDDFGFRWRSKNQ